MMIVMGISLSALLAAQLEIKKDSSINPFFQKKVAVYLNYDEKYPCNIVKENGSFYIDYNPDNLNETKLLEYADTLNIEDKLKIINKEIPLIKSGVVSTYDYSKAFKTEIDYGITTCGIGSTIIFINDTNVGVYFDTAYDASGGFVDLDGGATAGSFFTLIMAMTNNSIKQVVNSSWNQNQTVTYSTNVVNGTHAQLNFSDFNTDIDVSIRTNNLNVSDLGLLHWITFDDLDSQFVRDVITGTLTAATNPEMAYNRSNDVCRVGTGCISCPGNAASCDNPSIPLEIGNVWAGLSSWETCVWWKTDTEFTSSDLIFQKFRDLVLKISGNSGQYQMEWRNKTAPASDKTLDVNIGTHGPNEWSLLCAGYNSSDLFIARNDTIIANQRVDLNDIDHNTNNLIIEPGADFGASGGAAYLDDIYIFNKSLSVTERSDLYNLRIGNWTPWTSPQTDTGDSVRLFNYSIGFENISTGAPPPPDTTPPNISLITPFNNTLNNTHDIINFTYYINETSVSCELIINQTVNTTITDTLGVGVHSISGGRFGEGVYQWKVNCTDSEGNEGSSHFFVLEVDVPISLDNNLTSNLSLFLNGTPMDIILLEGELFNVSYLANISSDLIELRINGSLILNNTEQNLSVGHYNVTVSTNNSDKVHFNNKTLFAEVVTTIPIEDNNISTNTTVLLNGLNSDITVLFGAELRASQLTINGTGILTINGTTITNNSLLNLAVGHYNLTSTILQNTSVNRSQDTKFATVSRGTSEAVLTINGTRNDITFDFESNVSNTTAISFNGTITLFRNGTELGTSVNRVENIAELAPGIYNFTAIINQSQNYSLSRETWDLTIQNGSVPIIIPPAKRPKFFVANTTGIKQWWIDFAGNSWFRGIINVSKSAYLAVDIGNVGIGTDNPTSKLHVIGNVNISNGLTVGGESTFKNNLHILDNIKTYYGSFDDVSIEFDMNDLVWTAEVGSPNLNFNDFNNVIFNSDTLFIDYSNGRVGIGIETPTSKLHVDGNLNMSGNRITDIERLTAPDGSSIRFGEDAPFSGLDQSIVISSNQKLLGGEIVFAIIDTAEDKLIEALQVGEPNAGSFRRNSQIISGDFGLHNATILTSCIEMSELMGIDLLIGCNTTKLGATLLLEGSARIVHKLVIGGGNKTTYGIQSRGFSLYNMEGNSFVIFNGSQIIQTPITFEQGFTIGQEAELLLATFPTILDPFSNDQIDTGNWVTTPSLLFCDSGECAMADGSGSGDVFMSANYTSSNFNQTNVSFIYSLIGVIGGSIFNVFADIGAGDSLIFSDTGTDTMVQQTILLDNTFSDQDQIRLRFECDANNLNKQCYVDTISVKGVAKINTVTNISNFNSQLCFSSAELGESGRCERGIFYSAEQDDTFIQGNLNITGNLLVEGCIKHSCGTGTCVQIGTCN